MGVPAYWATAPRYWAATLGHGLADATALLSSTGVVVLLWLPEATGSQHALAELAALAYVETKACVADQPEHVRQVAKAWLRLEAALRLIWLCRSMLEGELAEASGLFSTQVLAQHVLQSNTAEGHTPPSAIVALDLSSSVPAHAAGAALDLTGRSISLGELRPLAVPICMSKTHSTRPATTAKPADWPRLAEAPGQPETCHGAESNLRSPS